VPVTSAVSRRARSAALASASALLLAACTASSPRGGDVIPLAPGATPLAVQPVTDARPPDGGQPQQLNTPDDQAMVFNPMAVWDPQAGNIPALTFLVPEGWSAEGSVTWMPFWSRLAHLHTRIVKDETGLVIEWLPIQDFIWFEAPAGFEIPLGSNYQGKAFVAPIVDPAQFVSQFWGSGSLAHLQDATLVRVDQVPAAAQEFLNQFGGTGEAFAYRLYYQYDFGGQPWEEEVSFSLLYTGSQGITSWYVNFATAVRAPMGGLAANAPLVSTVLASRVTTPEWEGIYRLAQHLFRQGLQQQMADTVAFGRALEQYRAETQALQQQVTAERQAAQDRIAELRQEILSGVETFDDPFTQQPVQLPVGWNDYYVNDRGQYLVTESGVDPTSVAGPGWQRLEPRR
jgi:hypothetical protein